MESDAFRGTATHTVTSVTDLPPEIICAILGRLSNKDLVSARVAHRCFSVQETGATKTRRIHNLWLRTSPERACEVGRADVLAYLYTQNRVPKTANLCAAAVESGSVDVVRLVRQRCIYWNGGRYCWNDNNALESALVKGHVGIAWHLIEESTSLDFRALLSKAIRLGRTEIIDRLIATRHPKWNAPYALCVAAACGNMDVVAASVPVPDTSLRMALLRASSRGHVEIVCFLLDIAPQIGPTYALRWAARSVGVVRMLLERYPDLDARHLFDSPRVSLEVARFLRVVYPDRSLQRFLENAESVDAARFACESDPRLDLQVGMDAAATKHCFDIVKSLYERDNTLDLGRAVAIAANMETTNVIEMLYATNPKIDLQRALDLAKHPSFAKQLCRAHLDLCVNALIARYGCLGEWAFLRDLARQGRLRQQQ
ncbi:Ankyrin repeat domain containing protein [Pandoravirus macleodensis]|uniref:Ankyrin repeat domain containing protein n=1 Tax=Pandoravirus macleodensis TaxID=2107707 RepID=A0A2U7UFH6_9VIRU|nr:Ankyrin repeat domain containing protein [Pandoravirus macleodensis]AVK77162.1 Ankyrin repeat domain containing protein [Pandoravirus macleodensis]